MGLSVTWILVAWTAGLVAPVACVTHNVNSHICSFTPDSSPINVECDLRGDSIVITHGNLPRSARQVQISNAHEVEVRENALSRLLQTPKSIRFQNISTLKIRKNSQATHRRGGTVSVVVDRVRYVLLETGALSHWQHTSLNVSMTNIDSCTIYGAAFVSNSTSTTILLENIKGAYFYPGTFGTTIGQLMLKNVSLPHPCRRNTYSGRIGQLSLASVTQNLVNSGCFRANRGWNSLDVRSSHLGNIRKRGLQGRIKDVRIKKSWIDSLVQNGIDLSVSRFSMKTCAIQSLMSGALNVRASDSISLLMTNITTIRNGAFRRLQLNNTGQCMKLEHLSFDQTFNGSLRFADVNLVSLRELLFRVSCLCNIRRQASQLLFARKGPPSTLTKENRAKLFQSIFKNVRCLHNETKLTLKEYHCQHCPRRITALCSKATTSTGAAEAPAVSGVLSWIPYVSATVCLLLVAAVVALLVRRCRRSVPRRRSQRPRRPPSGRITVADIVHIGPDQQTNGQPMSFMSNASSSDQFDETPQEDHTMPAAKCASYVNIPQNPACDEDQPLYEEDAVCERTREGLAKVHKSNSTSDLLLNTEDSKSKTNTKSSETNQRSKQTVRSPVYVQVNKSLLTPENPDTSQQPRAATEPVYAKVNKSRTTTKTAAAGQRSEATTDLPLYARVKRSKSNTNEHGEDQAAGSHDSGTTPKTSFSPQRNKTKSTTTSLETSQQPVIVTDTPLYAKVSRVAPVTDSSEGSPRNDCLSTTRLYGYAVHARPQPTEVTAPASKTEPSKKSSLCVNHATDTPAEMEPATDEHCDSLVENKLYGTAKQQTD